MNKERIERLCNTVGLAAVHRESFREWDICIADGMSSPPHLPWRRFGVSRFEFPIGCYVTMWWALKDEKLDTAQPLFFDRLHDPNLTRSVTQSARINRAVAEAQVFLKVRRKVALHG